MKLKIPKAIPVLITAQVLGSVGMVEYELCIGPSRLFVFFLVFLFLSEFQSLIFVYLIDPQVIDELSNASAAVTVSCFLHRDYSELIVVVFSNCVDRGL